MTKAQTIDALVKVTGLRKKDINEVLNSLTAIGYEEMRVNGKFTIPNFGSLTVMEDNVIKTNFKFRAVNAIEDMLLA